MDKSCYFNFLKRVDDIYANRIKSKFSLDGEAYHAFIKEKSSNLDINNFKIIKDHTLEEFFTKYRKYLGKNIIILDKDELWLMNPKKEYWEIKNDSKSLYFEVPTKTLMFMYPYGCALTAFLLVAGLVTGVLCGTLLNKGSTPGGGGGEDDPEPIPENVWYGKENWWDYCSSGEDGLDGIPQASAEDIGKTVSVTLNGLKHKVRLVDIDKRNIIKKEYYEIIGVSHCVFEFVNVITDQNGPVLINWNEENGQGSLSNKYDGSTIEKALKENGLIYNMIANDCNDLLNKIVYSEVHTYYCGSSWSKYDLAYKLFPLDLRNYNYTETIVDYQTSEQGYTYYIDNPNSSSRQKKAVNSTSNTSYWAINPYSRNITTELDNPDKAASIDTNGNVTPLTVYNSKIGVAPAFCI